MESPNDHNYVLIDEDGNMKLTSNIPDLSYCSFPIAFRVSNEVGCIIEKINVNEEWEVMELNNE